MILFHHHFISWTGAVTSISLPSFNFFPLYHLLEDGHMSGRNVYEVLLYIGTISLVWSLLLLLLDCIQLMLTLWIM